jgi:hypothetical protein
VNKRTLDRWMSKIEETNLRKKKTNGCLTVEQNEKLKLIIKSLNATRMII